MTCLSEISPATLPPSGWYECGVQDLGPDRTKHVTCEYCRQERVRYLHTVDHPSDKFPTLDVGCVCAGHLTGSPEYAKAADDAVRKLTARRETWPTLKWRQGQGGKFFLRKDGMVFVLKPGKFGGYAASFKNQSDEWRRVDGFHEIGVAKMSLFEAAYGEGRSS